MSLPLHLGDGSPASAATQIALARGTKLPDLAREKPPPATSTANSTVTPTAAGDIARIAAGRMRLLPNPRIADWLPVHRAEIRVRWWTHVRYPARTDENISRPGGRDSLEAASCGEFPRAKALLEPNQGPKRRARGAQVTPRLPRSR
jgi:hypothetical protein